jgi:CRP/FNR family transcriptional regulator
MAGLDDIAHDARRTPVQARETLFREGDPTSTVIMLVSGMAKLSRLMADGRQQVLGFRFAGDMMGFTHGHSHAADAEMLTDGMVCRMTRSQLDAMLLREGRAALAGSVFQCLPTRAELDLLGWSETDFFAH